MLKLEVFGIAEADLETDKLIDRRKREDYLCLATRNTGTKDRAVFAVFYIIIWIAEFDIAVNPFHWKMGYICSSKLVYISHSQLLFHMNKTCWPFRCGYFNMPGYLRQYKRCRWIGVLVLWVVRSSAAMVLTNAGKKSLVFHEGIWNNYIVSVLSNGWKCRCSFMFPKVH